MYNKNWVWDWLWLAPDTLCMRVVLVSTLPGHSSICSEQAFVCRPLFSFPCIHTLTASFLILLPAHPPAIPLNPEIHPNPGLPPNTHLHSLVWHPRIPWTPTLIIRERRGAESQFYLLHRLSGLALDEGQLMACQEFTTTIMQIQ